MIIHEANLMGCVKFMQQVLVRMPTEEYSPTVGTVPKLTAVFGQILMKGDEDRVVNTVVTRCTSLPQQCESKRCSHYDLTYLIGLTR